MKVAPVYVRRLRRSESSPFPPTLLRDPLTVATVRAAAHEAGAFLTEL